MFFDLLDINFKKGKCIIVSAFLSPYGSNDIIRRFNLILDTGASSTHISKEFLYRMEYDNTMFTKDKKESFAVIGRYHATLCKVSQINFCGVNFRNRTVKVWNPPTGHHVDGIIGMDILSYFNININMDTQKAYIEQSQSTKALLRKST